MLISGGKIPYFNHLLQEDRELEGQEEGQRCITSLEAIEESVGRYKRIPRCPISVSLSGANHARKPQPLLSFLLSCRQMSAIRLYG